MARRAPGSLRGFTGITLDHLVQLPVSSCPREGRDRSEAGARGASSARIPVGILSSAATRPPAVARGSALIWVRTYGELYLALLCYLGCLLRLPRRGLRAA